jgi:hypothetical protein
MEEGRDKNVVTKWYQAFSSFDLVLIYLKYLAICVKILKYIIGKQSITYIGVTTVG